MKKCYICGRSMRSISGNRHFETHGLTSNQYLTYLYHDISKLDELKSLYTKMITIPKDRCLICDAVVNSVGSHVRIHNMKASEYRELVVKNPDSIQQLHKEWKSSHNGEIIHSRGVLEGRKAITTQTCKICGRSMKRIGNHLHDKHGITKPEYDKLTTEEIKNFISRPSLKSFRNRSTVETCKLCGRSFKWLNTHLSQSHGISRKEYDNMNGSTVLNKSSYPRSVSFTRDKVKCPVCEEYVTYINKEHVNSHGYKDQTEFIADNPGTQLFKSYHAGSDPKSYGASRVLVTKNGRSHDDDNNLIVKSGPEYDTIKYIDDTLSVHFEYETLELPYDDKTTNSVKMYTPDIYIPKYNLILEIKDDEFNSIDKIDDGSPLHDDVHYARYEDKVNKVLSLGYNYLLIKPCTVHQLPEYIAKLS